jgi:hypothetical protein
MASGDGDDELVASSEQGLYSDVAGLGPLNGIEWQADAPWRMEPGANGYDKIPLILTFHDAAFEVGSPPVGDRLRLTKLCGLYVVEGGEVTLIEPHQLHEIEASKRWLSSGELQDGESSHQVRRMWNGDSPDALVNISDWAEWHATALYQPHDTTPGANLGLIVMARISRFPTCTPEHPTMSRLHALWQVQGGRESNGYPTLSAPLHSGPLDVEHGLEWYFSDFVKVHLAAAPLPRFDDRWVYGDLHYHSQGTDNEGESAINYRGVSQAMKAIGLDYVFATEHASNSHQITGFHQIFLDDIPGIPGFLSAVEDYIIDWLQDHGIGWPVLESDALRDMSPPRFRHLHDWLNGTAGVNAQVGASGGSARRPQIFLGGEVDVIPEISNTEKQQGWFRFAHDRVYEWSRVCEQLPAPLIERFNFEEWVQCAGRIIYPGSTADRWALRDPQGLGEIAASRQHLVISRTIPARRVR